MTAQEALKLIPGDRVVYNEGTEFEAHGAVADVGHLGVTILFDDEEFGMVHPRDMRLFKREGT